LISLHVGGTTKVWREISRVCFFDVRCPHPQLEQQINALVHALDHENAKKKYQQVRPMAVVRQRVMQAKKEAAVALRPPKSTADAKSLGWRTFLSSARLTARLTCAASPKFAFIESEWVVLD
jgi:hypothetical protein